MIQTTTIMPNLIPAPPAWVDLDALAPDLRADVAHAVHQLAPIARQVAELVHRHADAIAEALEVMERADALDLGAWREPMEQVLGTSLLFDMLSVLGATDAGPYSAEALAEVVERLGGAA